MTQAARRLQAQAPSREPVNDFVQLHLAGVGAFNGGDPATAALHLRRALALRPDHANTLANLGAALSVLGNWDEALPALRRAALLAPDSFSAHTNLGAALRLAGQPQAALAECRRATDLAPANAVGWLNLARTLLELQRLEEAVAALRRTVDLSPDEVDAWCLLGDALCRLRRPGEAVPAARRLAELSPGNASAYWNLAGVLTDLGQHEGAVDAARCAVALAPESGAAHGALARALRGARRWEDAVAASRRAIALAPVEARLHHGLGVALVELGQEAEAAAAYTEALRLQPGLVDALVNLGRLQPDPEAAIALYRQALDMDPGHVTARFNQSLAFLALGRFAEGWADYEYRHLVPSHSTPPDFPAPVWKGEELAGKRILLLPEQGLGDQIQCARYAPLLRALGARVALLVRPELERLLRESGLADETYGAGEVPAADFKLPLMSLPHRFGTNAGNVPLAGGYLGWPPRPPRPAEAEGRFRIGIVWQGSFLHPSDRKRSVPMAAFETLALPGTEMVSLQTGPAALAADGHQFILQPAVPLGDFAATAEVVAGLDLVISVDTAVAHLAGAMGCPVWLLLPEPCDWRWLRHREDSPWYSSMRLFRQATSGDWESVFRRVRGALQRRVGRRGAKNGSQS